MQLTQFEPTTRRIVEQLAGEALVSVHVLSDELQQYVDELSTHTSNAELFDEGIVGRISGLCWKLLEALPEKPGEREHRLTQLAINYFVLSEDAQDDNHALVVFDDDLEVGTVVIRELDLEHLLEEN